MVTSRSDQGNSRITAAGASSGDLLTVKETAPAVGWLSTSFVNTYLVGEARAPWVLVDTGLPGFAWKIRAAAQERFGRRPGAIVLTHGHIDHAGNARTLAEEWKVPIYCGRLELPYLTGRSDYPPPDPTVGGFIGNASRFIPHRALDLTPWIRELPAEGTITEMPGWRWLSTPGHSPGHISLFRESDRVLLGGDALATADMDSWLGAITNAQTLWRAGTPFTCDWQAARESVQRLAELQPEVIACGHGIPMGGPDLPARLRRFAGDFPMPAHGRYAAEPAITDESGVVRLPPKPSDPVPLIAAGLCVGAALGCWVGRHRRCTATESHGAIRLPRR